MNEQVHLGGEPENFPYEIFGEVNIFDPYFFQIIERKQFDVSEAHNCG